MLNIVMWECYDA